MILKDRMDEKALAAYQRLPHATQTQVLEFLKENPREFLCGAKEVVNAYLVWNGIIGFTSGIVETVRLAYKEN